MTQNNTHIELCPECEGTGVETYTVGILEVKKPKKCTVCAGLGRVIVITTVIPATESNLKKNNYRDPNGY